MKLTKDNYLEVLNKLDACNYAIIRYSEKSNEEVNFLINLINQKEISLVDKELFNDLIWLKIELKSELQFIKISYKGSNGLSIEHTYDGEHGNELTYKNSNGFSYEHTYDEHGNELTYKGSNGTSSEYTYDD